MRPPTLLPRGADRKRLLAALAFVCMSSVHAEPASGPSPAIHCPPRAAILVYHRFSQTADDSMTVRVSTFETHLRFLREHGYHIVPLEDIVAWATQRGPAVPDKSVALTVDDGHRSVYELLRPIVLRDRFPVTLFIYPSAISNAGYAMTWDQLRELQRTGLFTIQSHTYWHPNFKRERRNRTPADFRAFVQTQLLSSKARLEKEIGTPVDMLAWPFGIYDDELIALARHDGYVAGFTLDARRVEPAARALALPRFLMIDAYGPTALARLLGDTSSDTCPAAEASRAHP